MSLPLSSQPPSASFKRDSIVTFDPLGVAAVLPNPRAANSAIRLYTETPRTSFRWPHLMQLGGSLAPLSVLVEHVLSYSELMHPALAMVNRTTRRIPVRSTTVFKELPLDFSRAWISEACNFKPSQNANNDFLIINIDLEHDEAQSRQEESKPKRRLTLAQRGVETIFTSINLFFGIVLAAELTLGVLLADIWAAVLFFIYFMHWLASTLVSYTQMIGPQQPPPVIVEDRTTQFAVYERPEGGSIIFKGRQDSLERWFRSTWQFNNTPLHSTLHWLWIITGAFTALGSTAAMVNMTAPLQLGFLGVLVLGSMVELALTRASRTVELKPYEARMQVLRNSHSRTEAIIRSVLHTIPTCRLDGLDWVELGLLPPRPVFREMQKMLDALTQYGEQMDEDMLISAVNDFRSKLSDKSGEKLVMRIANEALSAGRAALAAINRDVDCQQVVAGAKEGIF